MDNRPISRSEIPKLESLPDDIRSKIESVQEKTGFVPNVFLIMARQPDEFRGFCTYYDAIMETECGLTKAELEMIVVATSAQNNCLYCVVSHGAVLRVRAKDPVLSDQLAINFRKSKITKKQMAMLNFAVKVTKESDNISDKDLSVLSSFSSQIGLAYQVQDDVLDVTTSDEILGKRQNSDASKNKPSYPSIIGIDESIKIFESLYDKAIGELSQLSVDAEPLRLITKKLMSRSY